MKKGTIAVSIVSHGHGDMLERLVETLLLYPQITKIIVTFNIKEGVSFSNSERVITRLNLRTRGFAANHNSAFQNCEEEFFCPLNPDIEFKDDPFPRLLANMTHERVGLIAPRVESPTGQQEDSWRFFPTLFSIIRKVVFKEELNYPVCHGSVTFSPDWVAGMFLLFRADSFSEIGGFDEDFFLYYEDVDICIRLRKAGFTVLACPTVSVVHSAHRDSHRKLTYFFWHMKSFFLYLIKHRYIYERK